ncbi:MAG: hypothetical protein ACXW2X_07700, partial [Thermoanaerobaculia bacterium]
VPKVEVEVVYTQAEFLKALDTEDAYVVYEGHARFGQGPSFGDAGMPDIPDAKKYPVNPWGVFFRMGYDATDVPCFEDLVEHSIVPKDYDLPAATRNSFLHNDLALASLEAKIIAVRQKAGVVTPAEKKDPCSIPGSWREFAVCQPALAATKTSRNDEPLKSRHYFRQNVGAHKGKDEFMTAVEVGAADLNNTSLKCKVLFMAACSSGVHYREALEKRRKDAKSSCKFYLTAQVCSSFFSMAFITAVYKGIDPTSAKGSTDLLKTLNGLPKSGVVDIY